MSALAQTGTCPLTDPGDLRPPDVRQACRLNDRHDGVCTWHPAYGKDSALIRLADAAGKLAAKHADGKPTDGEPYEVTHLRRMLEWYDREHAPEIRNAGETWTTLNHPVTIRIQPEGEGRHACRIDELPSFSASGSFVEAMLDSAKMVLVKCIGPGGRRPGQ
jgi:hypothetical protein